MRTSVDVALCTEDPSFEQQAHALCERLGAPLETSLEEAVERHAIVLHLGADGLSLIGNELTIRGDFTRLAKRMEPGNLSHELVVRAAKVKGVDQPHVIDATAGLGEDSFLLAAAGFTVQLYERDPIIAAMLADALDRAAHDPVLATAASRMHLVEGDSIAALQSLTGPPDVVLLDPMFPAKQKSARVKKKLQVLQQLESPCEDEDALLDAALAAHPRKVVVKRPLKGPYLAGRKPSYSLSGKAIRYDCIVVPR